MARRRIIAIARRQIIAIARRKIIPEPAGLPSQSRPACLRRAGRLAFAEPAGLPARAGRLAFAEPAGLPSRYPFRRYFDFLEDVYEKGLMPY